MSDEDYLYLCVKFGKDFVEYSLAHEEKLFKVFLLVEEGDSIQPLFDDGTFFVSASKYGYAASMDLLSIFDAEPPETDGVTYMFDWKTLKFIQIIKNN